MSRYFEAADDRDEAALRDVLHPDAEVECEGFFAGTAAEFVTGVLPVLRERSRATLHSPSRIAVEVSSGAADARTAALAYHVRPGGEGAGRVDVIAAQYVDAFERRDGVWRIVRRRSSQRGRFRWPARAEMERALIVSSDGHVGARRMADYRGDLDPGLREDFDDFVAEFDQLTGGDAPSPT